MRTNRLLLLLLSVVLFAVGNWQWPFLRFTNYWVNQVFALLLFVLVLVLLVASGRRVSRWHTRWLAIPFTLGLLLLCLPFSLAALFLLVTLPPLGQAASPTFQKIEQINEHLAVYRTDGGATVDFGIVVQQERPVLLGLLLVKRVFSQYHLSQIAYSKTASHLTLRDPNSQQVLAEVPLKRFLYF